MSVNNGLRTWRPGARLAPDTWAAVRFDHGLSVLDLVADDWIERLNNAVAREKAPKLHAGLDLLTLPPEKIASDATSFSCTTLVRQTYTDVVPPG